MQVYVHHFFGNAALLNAEGAELRGSMTVPPLPAPYYLLANGSDLEPPELR